MKHWKRILGLGLSLAMVVSLAACGGDKDKAPAESKTAAPGQSAAASEEYPAATWKIAHAAQEGSASDVAIHAVKDYVEEKTGGKITIEIYPAGQLGADAAMLESVQLGELEFCSVGAFSLTTATSVWGAILWDIPYFFPTDVYTLADTYGLITEDPAWQDVFHNQIAKAGFHTMGITMQGDYMIFSKEPIRSVSDMAGIKIRASENAMVVDMLTEWGAQPTVVNMFECYTALEQGMIDAVYIPDSVAHQFTLEDVCPYITYYEGNPGPVLLQCSTEFYDSQSPLIQELIDEMGRVYQEEGLKAYGQFALEYIDIFQEAGCELIFLDEDQQAEWKDALSNTYTTWREKCGAETFDAAQTYIDTVILKK